MLYKSTIIIIIIIIIYTHFTAFRLLSDCFSASFCSTGFLVFCFCSFIKFLFWRSAISFWSHVKCLQSYCILPHRPIAICQLERHVHVLRKWAQINSAVTYRSHRHRQLGIQFAFWCSLQYFAHDMSLKHSEQVRFWKIRARWTGMV